MIRQIYYLLVSFLNYPSYIIDCVTFILDAKKKKLNPEYGFYACLTEKTPRMGYDPHYIYHPAWAARIIEKTKPSEHRDFSSALIFSAMMSSVTKMYFYDYRKPSVKGLSNFEADRADLLNLPFQDNSLESISCMHTIEHVGLGRYGDPVDSEGHLKAAKELSRVLKPGGQFIFVTPVGKPKIFLNAHRVFSYEQVLGMFPDLKLVETALVPDNHQELGLVASPSIEFINSQKYGCGCFLFTK